MKNIKKLSRPVIVAVLVLAVLVSVLLINKYTRKGKIEKPSEVSQQQNQKASDEYKITEAQNILDDESETKDMQPAQAKPLEEQIAEAENILADENSESSDRDTSIDSGATSNNNNAGLGQAEEAQSLLDSE